MCIANSCPSEDTSGQPTGPDAASWASETLEVRGRSGNNPCWVWVDEACALYELDPPRPKQQASKAAAVVGVGGEDTAADGGNGAAHSAAAAGLPAAGSRKKKAGTQAALLVPVHTRSKVGP